MKKLFVVLLCCLTAGAALCEPASVSDLTGLGMSAELAEKLAPHQAQKTHSDIKWDFAQTTATAGNAPYGGLLQSFLFNGTYNHYAVIGFNPASAVTGEGGLVNKASWTMVLENDFYDGATHQMEWYINYIDPTDTLEFFRPFYANVRRDLDGNGDNRAFLKLDIGTSSIQPGALYMKGGDDITYVTLTDAQRFVIHTPAAEVIAAAAVITANACGSIKRISSAGNVTTNTTNTFTAPAAANAGCIMHVCNVGANDIVLDNNANFKSAGGADITVTADDCVTVGSTGASGVWYQLTALVAN